MMYGRYEVLSREALVADRHPDVDAAMSAVAAMLADGLNVTLHSDCRRPGWNEWVRKPFDIFAYERAYHGYYDLVQGSDGRRG